MRVTRPGAKDNRIRLVWTKYFKYTFKGNEYYFKQKAYATYNDGWTNLETIKAQTYKNAMKRGNVCIEISEVDNGAKDYLVIKKMLEDHINSIKRINGGI